MVICKQIPAAGRGMTFVNAGAAGTVYLYP